MRKSPLLFVLYLKVSLYNMLVLNIIIKLLYYAYYDAGE